MGETKVTKEQVLDYINGLEDEGTAYEIQDALYSKLDELEFGDEEELEEPDEEEMDG